MTVFDKNIAATGSLVLAATIAIGAFGAHGLKEMLDADSLSTFEVGVRYQMYHALGILILGLLPSISPKLKRIIFWFFVVGILFFSGSIYLLSLRAFLSFEVSSIGFVTPLGGLLFITGWVLMAYGLLTLKNR